MHGNTLLLTQGPKELIVAVRANRLQRIRAQQTETETETLVTINKLVLACHGIVTERILLHQQNRAVRHAMRYKHTEVF
jgi:hypothetical protein